MIAQSCFVCGGYDDKLNRSISIALLRRSRSHGYTKRVCLVTTTKKRHATSGGSNVSGRGDRG